MSVAISASMLYNLVQCPKRVALDLFGDPSIRDEVSPFVQLLWEQVGVDVTSVIRASPASFRVAWVERRYRGGSLAEASRWTAILTIVVQRPSTPDALRKDPLGIFVNAINWSKELGS